MSKQQWGNATWYLMHTLAEKIKPEFENLTPYLFIEFKNICANLPCPDCAEHAIHMFNTANTSLIVDKTSLVNFLHELHNRINIRLKKECMTINECKTKYQNANTLAIIRHFFKTLTNIRTGERAMIYTLRRTQCLLGFRNFLNKFIHIFNF